jgi:hypothetical protein
MVFAFAFWTFPSPLPVAPSTSLDFSWITGLNEAVRRNLVFGRDVAYTYGPLAFVAWPLDIGSNLVTAIAFRLFIHALFCLGIGLGLTVGGDWRFGLMFIAGLGLSGVTRNTEYVFMIAVLIFILCAAFQHQPLAALPAAPLTAIAILVKFNIGVTCTLGVAAWALLELSSQERRRDFKLPFVLFMALGVGIFLLLFRAYGGPLGALPGFLHNSFLLASGYSAQLALPGPELDYWFAGLLLALIVGTALGNAFRGDRQFLTYVFVLAAPLFMMFKGGFVRQDSWHVWSFIEGLAAVGCLLLLVPCDRRRKWPVALAVLGCLGIAACWHQQQPLPASFRRLLPSGHENVLALARWPIEREAAQVGAELFRRHQALPPGLVARIGDAPVDVYPLASSLALANRLNWSPRLIFQSHVAYTPELDEQSARHYRSPAGPRFVLYLPQRIDDPSAICAWSQGPAVDPLTWLELYRWYDAVEWDGPLGLLERRATPRFGSPVLQGNCSLALGKRWPLSYPEMRNQESGVGSPGREPGHLMPPARQPLWVKARFRLTTLGILRDKSFKVYPPTMSVHYDDELIVRFRVAWRNVANGFLVSDLPLTAGQIQSFWNRGPGAHVKSISFHADQRYFEGTVDLEWYTLGLGSS